MKVKNTVIKAYEFSTPKFGGDIQYEHVYDYELIDILFNAILKLNKSQRKYKDETVSINLGDFRPSNDPNIVEGYFITAKHGIKRNHIDIETQEEIGTIEKTHGVENNVYFMIDRRTGLLLVQDDFNKVFSRKLLSTFLHSHKKLIYPYIDKFNDINKDNKLMIHKRSCYRLTTLPPVDFLDKLKEFTKVKTATLTLDSTTEKRDVSEVLDSELEENGIKGYDLEIKIKNKTGRSTVRIFEKYFTSIIEQQKYDSYAIEGVLTNGRSKKITPDSITRDFYINVKVNSSGQPSMEEVFNGMSTIILKKNPIKNKTATPNLTMVGEDKDVEVAMENEILQRNQDQTSQHKTS